LNPESTGEYPDLGPLSAHLFPHLPLGVTLFFALSGFLLYRPFASATLRGTALPSRRSYLRNRALRILPAYWFWLFLTAVVFGLAAVRVHSSVETGRILDPLTLLAAAALIQNYIPGTLLAGIAGTWSLAVEAAFYLHCRSSPYSRLRWPLEARGGATGDSRPSSPCCYCWWSGCRERPSL
jgi:peptidoglycan/LPS O-acetylase OafA/YrhL